MNHTALLSIDQRSRARVSTAVLFFAFLLCCMHAGAQNVGIGTSTPDPSFRLDVAGSIRTSMNLVAMNRIGVGGPGNIGYKLYVHSGPSYLEGNLTTTGNANIDGGLNVAGATIIDNNFRVNGRIGVNGATNSNYGLIVNAANSYFEGNTTTTGSSTVQGALNVTGSGIVDENFRVNGRVGINGATNANYGLIVNNSNSYFQGNTTTTGIANVQGDLVIKGNGHVRTNGSSNLQIGFTSKTVDLVISNGAAVSVTANISPFSGSTADARVMVAQVVNDIGGTVPWSKVKITVMGVDPNTNTCLLWLHNASGANGTLAGTIYLTTISRE